MKMDISTEELIAEMQRVVEENAPAADDDPGLSTREWSKVWGVSTRTAGERLRDLWEAGLIERGKKKMEYINGLMGRVTVYRARGE